MLTINKKFNYPKLKQVTQPNGFRVYDPGYGKPLVSVTTILSATKSRESIQTLSNWQDRVGAKEADRITNLSADLGQTMHDSLENWILRGDPPHGAPMSKIMAQQIIKKGLSKVDEVWGTESQLYYPEMYAGTADLLGIHQSAEAVMDFKNSRRDKKEEWITDYKLQCAAYAIAHDKLFGTSIKKGVIMMATHEGKYLEFIIEGNDFKATKQEWLNKVYKYYSKR
jgi:genome maintenance exonuclease 1